MSFADFMLSIGLKIKKSMMNRLKNRSAMSRFRVVFEIAGIVFLYDISVTEAMNIVNIMSK